MYCKICTHEKRAEIENVLLNKSPSVSISDIAEAYDVPEDELKVHALYHSPLGMSDEETTSIVKNLKIRESDMLSEVAMEYLVTLKGLGRKINSVMTEDVDPVVVSRSLGKSTVEMYLGLGSEIRKTVVAIAEIDQMLNGPERDNTSGLAALVSAINASKP